MVPGGRIDEGIIRMSPVMERSEWGRVLPDKGGEILQDEIKCQRCEGCMLMSLLSLECGAVQVFVDGLAFLPAHLLVLLGNTCTLGKFSKIVKHCGECHTR